MMFKSILFKKVQVGKDQEKAQSEKDSQSKIRKRRNQKKIPTPRSRKCAIRKRFPLHQGLVSLGSSYTELHSDK